MSKDQLHTPGTASIRFGVSPALIRLRCREGLIEYEKDPNGRHIIRESAMVRFMNERAAKKRAAKIGKH